MPVDAARDKVAVARAQGLPHLVQDTASQLQRLRQATEGEPPGPSSVHQGLVAPAASMWLVAGAPMDEMVRVPVCTGGVSDTPRPHPAGAVPEHLARPVQSIGVPGMPQLPPPLLVPRGPIAGVSQVGLDSVTARPLGLQRPIPDAGDRMVRTWTRLICRAAG